MKVRAEEALRELMQRAFIPQRINLRHPDFTTQNNFIDDPNRFVAANCSRRSGKSIGLGIRFVEQGVKYPGSNIVYFGLTRGSATSILWDPLEEMLDAAKIRYKTVRSNNVADYGFRLLDPNSKIVFAGVDANKKEMKKILGQKLREVGIDEAGSYTIDMKVFVYQMVMAALSDVMGRLNLIGTCEDIPNTFFEKVCTGEETERRWSVHRWTAYENPFMKYNWDLEMRDILSGNPKVKEASWFRTHYLNEWVTNEDRLIIKVSDYNLIDSAPEKLRYVLGIDLGYNDDTAFSVIGWRPHDRKAYVVHAEKHPKMDFTDCAETIHRLTHRFAITQMEVDGANKQGVEEMRKRHQLPLEAAEKQGKNTYLRLLRDELIQGHVELVETQTTALQTEWSHLVWKDDMREVEDARCQNHLSDATLYAWRHIYSYCTTPEPEPPPQIHEKKYQEKLLEDHIERIKNERHAEENGYW